MFETKSVSTAQLTKRMFSNASLYGVGMIFLRFGNLLVLPFLWGKLTPADFGLIAGAQILIQFLGPLIDLGISSIIQRLFFEWEESARGKHLAALFVVTLISSFTICCLLDLFGPYLASLVFESIPFEIFRVAIWTVFFSNLAVTPLAIMRAQEQIKLYTVVNTASFLIQITLICIFVFVFDWGAVGYLLGTLTSAALLSFYYLFFVSRYLSFPFKVSDLKEPMKYGLPLVPGTALEGANAVLDRYFLEHVVSLASLGLYNLARQFSGAFNMFLVILKTSWIPLIYKITSERDDSPKILAEMSIFYFASFFFPALAVALISSDLIQLIGRPEYFGVAEFIPYFVGAYVIQGFGHAFGRGLDLSKKTSLSFLIYAAGLAVNITALYLLVPKYGALGGCWAFALALAARETVNIFLAYRYFPRPTYWRRLLSCLALFVVAYSVGTLFNLTPIANILLKMGWITFVSVAAVAVALGPKRLRYLHGKIKTR